MGALKHAATAMAVSANDSGLPARVRLSRTRGWRMPANTVSVDRSGRWGNPMRAVRVSKHYSWSVTEHGAEIPILCRTKADAHALAVALYRSWIAKPEQLALRNEMRAALTGKNVGCWCAVGSPCHGDVILTIANSPAEPVQ